jgi:glycosyltransferase involved in cell wall biosynthesis
MNFLIFGTILNKDSFTYNLAANPASTKWLNGLATGLSEGGNKITLLGHCYEQAWPKGKLFPGKSSYLEHKFDNHLVRFLNVPGIRFSSMAWSYYRQALKQLSHSHYDVIVTYNPYPWHASPARRLSKKFKIPWISLNLDFDDVGPDWENFLRDAGNADGHLFLSRWGYEKAPVERKIHLDSGVAQLTPIFGPREEGTTLNLVYLGGLAKINGLEVLMELPKAIPDANVRFIFGGKAHPEPSRRLQQLAMQDSRVEYRGFVRDDEVEELFARADVFLNPRDPDSVVNDMVFPSKVLHYLASGKTLVSTWTKGLDEAYRELMRTVPASKTIQRRCGKPCRKREMSES